MSLSMALSRVQARTVVTSVTGSTSQIASFSTISFIGGVLSAARDFAGEPDASEDTDLAEADALLTRSPPPCVVVSDGDSIFKKKNPRCHYYSTFRFCSAGEPGLSRALPLSALGRSDSASFLTTR